MKKNYVLLSFALLLTIVSQAQVCLDTLYRNSSQLGAHRDIAAIDWNNDGAMDYVLANDDSNLVYIHYRNSGNRLFSPAGLQPLLAINDPQKIRVVDFDGDGDKELAILHHGQGFDDSVKVLFSDGAGGISSIGHIDVPNVELLDVNDFDMDGKPDLIVAEGISGGGSNFFYTYRNLGGTFSTSSSHVIPYCSFKGMKMADFDGDGDQDIFLGSSDSFWDGSAFHDTSKVFVVLNTTSGISFSFADQFSYTFPPDTRLVDITAADFNGDSKADLAVTLDMQNNVAVMLNNGAGGFGSPINNITTGNYPKPLDHGDLDGDGDEDLATSLYYGGADVVLLNDGTGNFTMQAFTTSNYYTALQLVDIDGDGMKDLLKASYVNTTGFETYEAVYYNNSNASASITSINGNIFCEGSSGQFTISSAHPGFQAGLSYQWQDTSTDDTLSYTASTGLTTISATVTNAQGCTIGSSVGLTVNPLPNTELGNDVISCSSGFNIGVGPEGGVVYSWSSNPPGFSSTSSLPLVSPAVPTLYYINATNTFGCSSTDSVNVTLFPPVNVTGLGTYLDVCEGLTINLGDYVYPTSGTAPFTYNWFSGFNTYTVANPAHFADVSQNFTITITDANGCNGPAGALLTNVRASTDTWGHISTPTVPLVAGNSGAVYAFKYQPGSAALDTVDIAIINPAGDYAFFSLDSGLYLIKAILDTSFYSLAIPTYYGNTFQWDSSVVFSHNCTLQDTANIQVLEVDTTQTGPGTVSGYVFEGVAFGTARYVPGVIPPPHVCVPGGPLKGIDVKLGKNPGGGIQARMMTDSTGKYEFTNLPLQGYKIYVDIPNLPMDSTREIVLDATNNTSVQNNYFADSASVYVTDTIVPVGIWSSDKAYDNHFSIYPNPAHSVLNLQFTNAQAGSSCFTISDAQGRLVYSSREQQFGAGEQKITLHVKELQLKSGVYFISIRNNSHYYTQRLVVME